MSLPANLTFLHHFSPSLLGACALKIFFFFRMSVQKVRKLNFRDFFCLHEFKTKGATSKKKRSFALLTVCTTKNRVQSNLDKIGVMSNYSSFSFSPLLWIFLWYIFFWHIRHTEALCCLRNRNTSCHFGGWVGGWVGWLTSFDDYPEIATMLTISFFFVCVFVVCVGGSLNFVILGMHRDASLTSGKGGGGGGPKTTEQ